MAFSMTAWAGTWQYQQAGAPGPGADPAGWRYQQDDGSYAVNGWINDQGKWYFIDRDGIMATGWLIKDGTWYYLDDTGAMVGGTTKSIDGVEYAFDESGAMKSESGTGWNGNTYTSSRFRYQVTFPEGFLPLDDYIPLFSDEDMTFDMAAGAPDMTVSMMVLVFHGLEEELKSADVKQLAEELKEALYDPEDDEAGKVEMVTLGGNEYAKLTLRDADNMGGDWYFRRIGNSVMMVQMLYDSNKKDMADGIMKTFN